MATSVCESPREVSLKQLIATESSVCTRAFPRLASGCEGVGACSRCEGVRYVQVHTLCEGVGV